MSDFEISLLRLALAVLVGGIIGAEREYRNKSAGFRTMILISMGSCLFTIFSQHLGLPYNGDRIASNIVTGIGFLGAGVIFKSDDRVKGLTTAATIWLTASLGMGIGSGSYLLPLAGCLMAMMVLVAFSLLEGFIDRSNQIRTYTIVCEYQPGELKRFEHVFTRCGLKFTPLKKSRKGTELTASWKIRGKEKFHDQMINEILRDSEVKEFEF
jgi:putative Mg2+ transporter-C (MgtC) family protein